jgi:hypothetical protein
LVSLFGAAAAALLCVAVICFWNELMLPAWLLSRSSHPLAKAALGLGLVLTSLLFLATTILWGMKGYQSQEERILGGIATAAVAAGIFGKILCLAGTPQGSVQGALLWSISADLAAFVINLGRTSATSDGNNDGGSRVDFVPLLYLIGAMLLVLALKRMAHQFNDPHLERKARRLLLGIAVATVVAMAAVLLRSYVVAYLLPVAIFSSLIVLIGVARFARLVRGLQEHVLQRF